MKKLIIYFMTFALALSLSVQAFADENQGGEPTLPAEIDARIDLVSVNNISPSLNATVYAGGSFNVSFRLSVPGEYLYGSYEASVSGSGFSMDGSSATRYGENYNTELITIPVRVDASQESGRYPLTVNVLYKNGNVSANLSQTVNVNVVGMGSAPEQPEPEEPYAEMTVTDAPDGAVRAGETFKIDFTTALHNLDYLNYYTTARGTVTVEGEGFSLAGALAEEDITTGSESVEVLCDPNQTSGRKKLTVTATFTVDSKTYTASRSLNIDVVGEEEDEEVDESHEAAAFTMTSASIPEGRGKSKLSTKLTLEFKNKTVYEARDLKIRLASLGDIILNTYTDTVEAGNVPAGGTAKAVFPIKFAEYPSAQTALAVELTYEGPTGPITETFNAYLQATEKEKKEETPPTENDVLTPKVIVKSFTLNPEEVVSGEEFDLSFILQNTSQDRDLMNMDVSVDVSGAYSSSGANGSGGSSGPVFSFVNGTSSFYTETLPKSGETEYTLRLKCNATAGAGTYPIKITFNFQYEKSSSYLPGNGDITINIPVTQPIKFELVDWTPPTECGPDGAAISFQYFNKSKNPMTALGIGVEGDFTMETQYPGSLAASSAEFFSGTIMPVDPSAVGETKHAILFFTFEDSAGVEKRIDFPFDVTITETSTMGGDMMGGDMMGGDMMGGDYVDPGFETPVMPGEFDEFGNPVMSDEAEQSGGFPLWAKIAIPCAAVVVLIVVIVVVKKVKAKKEALEDEED